MKKTLGLLLLVCFGMALDRMFQVAPATAAGGGEEGGGVALSWSVGEFLVQSVGEWK